MGAAFHTSIILRRSGKIGVLSLTPHIQKLSGRPGPARALLFDCNAEWSGPDDAILVSLNGRLKLPDDMVLSELVVLDRVLWPDPNNPFLKQRRNLPFSMVAPMTAGALSLIEERRKGGDISVRLQIRYQYQDGRWPSNSPPIPIVRWADTSTEYRIPHSDWIKRLDELRWAEIELFEIISLPLKEDKNLNESLVLLRKAQRNLRDGDYAGVLITCRTALESAAKYAVERDSLKAGFEALLQNCFKEHSDKPVRMSELLEALSDYLHLARHAQYPVIRFTRAEAEFVLTTTISFFSLISRRLAGLETVS